MCEDEESKVQRRKRSLPVITDCIQRINIIYPVPSKIIYFFVTKLIIRVSEDTVYKD